MSNVNYEFASDELVAKDGKVPFDLQATCFPGFYDSVLWNADMICDDLHEEWRENGVGDRELNDEEVDELYESIDREAYEKAVIEKYMDSYICIINSECAGLIEPIPSQGVEMSSPAYYNYSTDKIFQTVMLDIDVLKKIHEESIKSEDFKEYIKDNFTPRDGYIPFPSAHLRDWENLNELDTLDVNLLLQFYTDNKLVKKNYVDMHENCVWDVLDSNIRPLEYIDPEVKAKIEGKIKGECKVHQESNKKEINVLAKPKKKGGVSL